MLTDPRTRFARRLLFQENLHKAKVRAEEPPTFTYSDDQEAEYEDDSPHISLEVPEDLPVNHDTSPAE